MSTPECSFGSCVWQFDLTKRVTVCVTSTGSDCLQCKLLEAEPSEFHDEQLVEATRKIKAILDAIPPDPKGRQLSFINTRMGTLIAWVRPGGAPRKGAVTSKDDDATVKKALGIKTARRRRTARR